MRATILAVLFFVCCAAVNPAGAQTAPPYPPPAGAAPPPPYPPTWIAPPPSGAPPMVHRKRVGLLISGAIVVGAMQGIALLVALNKRCDFETSVANQANCEATRNYVWIPIVGPLVREGVKTDSDTSDWAFAVGWGLAEIAGGVMFGVGLAGRDVPAPSLYRGPVWGVIPLKTRSASGLALRLEF